MLALFQKFTSAAAPSESDSSESIRSAIDVGRRAEVEIEAEIGVISQRRDALLVDGSDKDVDRVDVELANARRSLDRTRARLVELQRRLEVADKRERAALLDAAYDRALFHTSQSERLSGEYRALLDKMRKVISEWDTHAAEHRAALKLLVDLGDERRPRNPFSVVPSI